MTCLYITTAAVAAAHIFGRNAVKAVEVKLGQQGTGSMLKRNI